MFRYNDNVTEIHVRSCFRPSCVTVLGTLLISSISDLFNDAALTSVVIEGVSGVKVSILTVVYVYLLLSTYS